MSAPEQIVIFGLGGLSSLAWHCIVNDSPWKPVAFTVDRGFRDRGSLHGLPAVDFETLEEVFPPDRAGLLVPLGGRDANGLRMARYLEGKRRGYAFPGYISSRAAVAKDVVPGDNTLIFDQAVVEAFTTIGANCMLRSGAHVSHHAVIGDHCFLASEATIGGGAVLGERCFVGLNATVLDGVRLAARTLVAAGATVTRDTEAGGIYAGSPARRAPNAGNPLAEARGEGPSGSGGAAPPTDV